MTRRPSERDLRHDADSVRFGDAVARCEGYAPACAEQGRCLGDGACFSNSAHLVAARMIEGLLPTDGRAGVHFAYLRQVVEMLRAGRVHL